MIIWLASYPKSGNTWIRTIIGQFFDKEKKDTEVFTSLKKIKIYPHKSDFFEFNDVFKENKFSENNKKQVIESTIKYWIDSQKKINSNNKINILKTHNMLCKINLGETSNSFTDLENTLGAIHIVRDPRNIFTSIKNHFSMNNDEETLDFMMRENNWIGFNENRIPDYLSSWKNHYNSWKRFPKNNLLIKYEDLLFDPYNQIIRLRDYLKKFINIDVSVNDIEKIVKNTSFENFQKLEREGRFDENALNTFSGKKKTFFNMGPKNVSKILLNKKILELLENKLKPELIELQYL